MEPNSWNDVITSADGTNADYISPSEIAADIEGSVIDYQMRRKTPSFSYGDIRRYMVSA